MPKSNDKLIVHDSNLKGAKQADERAREKDEERSAKAQALIVASSKCTESHPNWNFWLSLSSYSNGIRI